EVRYNSLTDTKIPPGFETMAKDVNVPLTVITLDARGTLVKREEKRANPPQSQGQFTIPLPAEAVPIGHTWSFPYDVDVTVTGGTKKIKTRQRFTLQEVTNKVASILVETQILSPVNNPEIEAQLIQIESNGTIRFDLEAGRVIG